MDFTKNVIGVLALMMVLMIVPTASAFTEYGGFFRYFEDSEVTAILIDIDDAETQQFRFKSSDDLVLGKEVQLWIVPVDGTGDNTTIVQFVCTHNSRTYDMGTSEIWSIADSVIVDFPLTDLGDDTLGDQCNITVTGEDIRMTAYIFPAVPDTTTTVSPTSAMSKIVNRVDGIMQSLFDLLEMMLIVSALILFVFVIVFIWKLIVYFANSISNKGRID